MTRSRPHASLYAGATIVTLLTFKWVASPNSCKIICRRSVAGPFSASAGRDRAREAQRLRQFTAPDFDVRKIQIFAAILFLLHLYGWRQDDYGVGLYDLYS
jgi:hypothetical protein